MEPISGDERDKLLSAYKQQALHLEMRDIYATDIERDRFSQWLRGEPLDPEEEAEWWRWWFELMDANMKAGKTMRRLRIVSEPVTDYIRFEWLDTDKLVEAGEEVRWLSRRKASTLFLPGNDFWLFDGEAVSFTHFDGAGHVLDHDITHDPGVVNACLTAFETAWKIATPHSEFKPV